MGRKKLPNAAEEKIQNYLNTYGYTDRDTLAEMVQDDILVPSYDELSRRYTIGKVNSIIAKSKDETGAREILGRSIKGGTEYIKIPTCKDRIRLETIQKKIQHNIDGLAKTHEKVSKRLRVVEGQIAMQFMVKKKTASLLEQENSHGLSKALN